MYLRSQLHMPAILLLFHQRSLDHMRNQPVLLPLPRHTLDLGEDGRHYMSCAQGTGEWAVQLVHIVLGTGEKILYILYIEGTSEWIVQLVHTVLGIGGKILYILYIEGTSDGLYSLYILYRDR